MSLSTVGMGGRHNLSEGLKKKFLSDLKCQKKLGLLGKPIGLNHVSPVPAITDWVPIFSQLLRS